MCQFLSRLTSCQRIPYKRLTSFRLDLGFPDTSDSRGGGGGGGRGVHLNSVCTGVCGHTIGKLTHSQTKAGPSISKNPFPDYVQQNMNQN